MALLKYKTTSGSYAALSAVNDNEISDISTDTNSLFLVNKSNTKIGTGVKLEDLASSIADSSNDSGGIISVIDDEE